ncbi:hypothetical protein W02_31500 [Nitrospira sp. KM1]|uniref:hypothetical protein n=1 Tax=Nitrospira sp. KM1 TaxID=1936990 RepID=UPI0013A7B142|nr:hypothetical protein [Nitrospira sp. KM1]BCA56010.1 hypothetical protein W02_31500 [Nitrospira sp. KM1]
MARAPQPFMSNHESQSRLSCYRFDEQRPYYLIFTVLLLLQLCPIWFTRYPAMHDYPNHLARAAILHEYSENTLYQATYERDGRPIPNLAIDLIVPALRNIVSIETSSKAFLSLIILAFNLGLHVLGLAIYGRPHWSALAATFFTYNFSFSYGFVNYMFGLGLFFITLAMWMRFCSRWTVHRLLTISMLAVLCYVSHLSAFVFLFIALGFLTGIHMMKTGSLKLEHVLGLLPLFPPAATYCLYGLGIQHQEPMEWWHPLLEKKLTGLLYPFLSYNLVIDLGLASVFMLLVLLSVKAKAIHFVNWELSWIGAILLALYVVSPMSGGIRSSYLDRRFLLPAAILLLLAIHIHASKKIGRYVIIGLLGLSVLRVGVVWHYWDRIGQEVQTQVRMLDQLPDGARLYPMVVHDQSAARSWLWDMHFFFTPHYATIYRHAFVPTLYAWDEAHPLHMRSAQTDYVQVERDTAFDHVNWGTIFSKYDYLWGYKLSEEFKQFLLSNGRLVAQSGDAVLIGLRGAKTSWLPPPQERTG